MLIALEVFWRDPRWYDPLVALAAAAIVTGFMAVRAMRTASTLEATGPVSHAMSFIVPVPLLLAPATAGGTLLFYGATMLLAAARRNSGCEVTVVSNALLGRADQLGCALFAPVDRAEQARPRVPAGER